MGLLRGHLAAVSIVLAAVTVTSGVFVVARPQYHPQELPPPPGDGLPYTRVQFTGADARRAFAAHGIQLLPSTGVAGIVGLHSRDDSVEVAVFGDRKLVDANGFSDYTTFADGTWQLRPESCVAGARSAERWHGNVRLIVDCDAKATLARAARALAQLPG